MSDSVQPHRQQPTRLPHPWDSPGKKTGVGCHCLLRAPPGKPLNQLYFNDIHLKKKNQRCSKVLSTEDVHHSTIHNNDKNFQTNSMFSERCYGLDWVPSEFICRSPNSQCDCTWRWCTRRCVCQSLSCVWLFATPWTVAHSSVHGILQARILECVTSPFSRGSSRSRNLTWLSGIAGRFFTVWDT